MHVAVLRETVPMDALRDYYDRAYSKVAEVLKPQGVAIVGPAVGVYFGVPTSSADVGAGFPTDRFASPREGVKAVTLPAGPAVQVTHVGSYDGLPQTYERLMAWFKAENRDPGDLLWETYLTEPTP